MDEGVRYSESPSYRGSTVPVFVSPSLPKVVRPVKLAAINTLLVYLKHFRKAEYRESICGRLVTGG